METVGQPPKETGRRYEITQMRNAAVVEWDQNGVLRVGDSFDEKTTDRIARCKVFDVTIKK